MHEVEASHWWYRGLRAMLGRLLVRHAISETPVILDAGCGTGENLRFMEERMPRARFIALDVSPDALRHIRPSANTTLLAGDVNALPLPDASVDLIVACDLLGQSGVALALAAGHFHRVLKPGGVVLANVPAFRCLQGEHDQAVHVEKRFARGELSAAFHPAGFHDTEERFWNMLTLPPMMAHRVLTRLRVSSGEPLRSDLKLTPAWLNPILSRWLEFEAALACRLPLPCGSSLFVVARKVVPSFSLVNPIRHNPSRPIVS